jgi:cell wall-associated NlpC family hydrolase
MVGVAAVLTVALVGGVAAADPVPTAAQAERMVLALQDKMGTATEDYNQARDELEASARRQVTLRKSTATLSRKVDTATATVAEFAAEAYRGGSMSMFTAVMSSGSPQMFLDQMATLDLLNADERRQLDQLLSARAKLQSDQAQLASERKLQTGQIQRLRDRKKQIETDLFKWTSLQDRYGFARASRSEIRIGPLVYAGPATGRAREAVAFAYSQMGKPYVWGASGPGSYDCSGLTMAAWNRAGVSMPHSARAQYDMFPKVPLDQLQPGDLVYYPGHIAIYVGDGMVIHAPTTGDVVRKAPFQRAGPGVVGAVRPS